VADAIQRRMRHNTKNVTMTAAGNYTMTDEVTLNVNKTVGGATTVTLPANPDNGREVKIKDAKGDAATNNITIQGASAATIDGGATLVISANYGSVVLSFNGTEWNVVALGSANGTITNITANTIAMTGAGAFISMPANSSTALIIKDSAGTQVNFDTTTNIRRTSFTGALSVTPTQTLASAAGLTWRGLYVPATTLTLTGTTEVTTAAGLNLVEIGQPTITDTMAVTVDQASTLYVANAPTAGGMVTITNAYSLWVAAGLTRLDGNLSLAAAASTITVKANTAATLAFTDGTTSILVVDTRNTVTGVSAVKITASPPTIASAAGDTFNQVSISAVTVTLTGTTTVTALNGIGMAIGTPTVTDTMACTVTTVSNLYVQKIAAAGGMITITNSYIINTDVAGCFLTNAGTWTNASSGSLKKDIASVDLAQVPGMLDEVDVVNYRYRDASDGGFLRFGLIAEKVPDFLADPRRTGIAPIHVAGFALAAAKYLRQENKELKVRVAELEKKMAA